MKSKSKNSYGTYQTLSVNGETISFFKLTDLDKKGLVNLTRLPYSIRILLENLLRNEDGQIVFSDDVRKILNYNPQKVIKTEIPFMPARVVLQDFTGVPAIVDLAAMRDAMKEAGGDPEKINPIVKADLVIDHSVQVDAFGNEGAFKLNVQKEYERNSERYSLLKWAQKSFRNFSTVPPGTGIVHQVNLEYLASVVMASELNGKKIAYPDTLVGTDSHTTMINGLSVLGWGVGGIEAEAVMLSQPYYMLLPEVVGVKLTGSLPEGATATDLVLTLTEMLRKHGVVGKFVEYFGSGLTNLSLPDRATIANMSPEYGATMGFFPIDDVLLTYLKLTARSPFTLQLVEHYAKTQGLFRTDQTPDPEYNSVLHLDMGTVEPSLAGPKRPQDRIPLKRTKSGFIEVLNNVFSKTDPENSEQNLKIDSEEVILRDGSVVIAAITSCTNTSNPAVMIAAGLVAKKALEKGLKTKRWVKTSLAPGSRVVTDYLKNAGLLDALEAQRFNLVGYGCTTCIGNSGPLPEIVEKTIKESNIVAVSVLSGNRNFEGRIHAAVKANYLASPPLVVVYALAGRIDIDLTNEPLGYASNGKPVYMDDILPTQDEILETVNRSLNAEMFREKYGKVYEGEENWQSLDVKKGKLYSWDSDSTYINKPPFFEHFSLDKPELSDIINARSLLMLGDTVTTDHISPAGAIPQESPAGQYLLGKGVKFRDFNSFGSRRGNHNVMIRGTFGNIRIKNQMLKNVEGGFTIFLPTGEQMYIYDAAMNYRKNNIPLIVLAGKEYGTGSSRDWAAKGTALLGVKAILAESYERIHRSNLIGMGVLPLQFMNGDCWKKLGLTGFESYQITGIQEGLEPGKEITVRASGKNGPETIFNVNVRLDTPVEVEYYNNGGILQTVLRQLIK